MKIEAVYSHGKLTFSQSIRFKHDPVKMEVEVPDYEIELNDSSYHLPESLLQETKELQSKFTEIRNSAMPSESAAPELTEKQLERIEVFKLREDLRKERGHTA